MATPPGAVLVPRAGTGGDDELDYLASGTLHKRRDFLERDAEARTAPNREFYFRKNADLDALIKACGRKLAQRCSDGAWLRALMIRGKAYLKKGEYQLAYNDYSTALEMAPASADAAFGRGEACLKLGRVESAIADYSSALAADPNHTKALYNRAAALNMVERFDEAVEDFNAALAKDREQKAVDHARPRPRHHTPGELSSAGGSLHGSPASSISSLQGLGEARHSALAEMSTWRANGGSFEGTTRTGLPTGAAAALPARGGGPPGHRRKPSRADAPPATSHFSIAAVLHAPAPPPLAAAAAAAGPAPADMGPTRIQLQHQHLQQQHFEGAELAANPRLDARQHSSALASVSGRSSEGAPTWQSAQGVLAKLTPRDGSGSVPLEVMSPLKQPPRAAAGAGGVQSTAAAAAAATVMSAAAASEEVQLEMEEVRPDPVAAAAAAAADAAAAAADAHHAAGYALRKAGNYEGAVHEYSLALAADPTHFRALFNRAFSLDKLGRYDEALADYEAAIAVDPQSSYAHYNAGIAADRLGHFARAVGLFSAAIDLEDSNPDFFHNRGFSLRKMERYEEAVVDYSRALELHPQHAKALYNRAVARERLRQLAPALDDYSAVLALDPGNVPARLNRAGLLQRLGRPAEALADVDAALKAEASSCGGSSCGSQEDGTDCVGRGASGGSNGSNSSAAAAWHLRGELLAELGRGAEALAAHERSAALDPTSSAFRRAYGLALRAVGQHEAAAAELASALTAAPEPDEAALSALGFCLRKLGRWDDAAAAYSELLALLQRQLRRRGAGGAGATASGADPGAVSSALVRVLNSRAFCLASGGSYAAAVADYDAALGLDPGNSHALMNRGLCLDKVGRHADAVADFSALIEREPRNATAYFNRAAALDALGLFDRAVQDYRRALDGEAH